MFVLKNMQYLSHGLKFESIKYDLLYPFLYYINYSIQTTACKPQLMNTDDLAHALFRYVENKDLVRYEYGKASNFMVVETVNINCLYVKYIEHRRKYIYSKQFTFVNYKNVEFRDDTLYYNNLAEMSENFISIYNPTPSIFDTLQKHATLIWGNLSSQNLFNQVCEKSMMFFDIYQKHSFAFNLIANDFMCKLRESGILDMIEYDKESAEIYNLPYPSKRQVNRIIRDIMVLMRATRGNKYIVRSISPWLI